MGNGTVAPTFFTDTAVKPFNPVPPAPVSPPPQKQAGGSPIHDFVVKNPTATPEQVQAQFPAISLDGIKAILPGVKQDVLKTWVPPAPQGPPPNAVQQAMVPIAPPPPQKGPQLNAFTPPGAPGYEPMGKPQVFSQAVSNTPPPPPQTLPIAPGPPPDAMAARQATLAGIPGYKPGALAPPGEGGVGMQSGPPMQDGGGHGGNSFLDGLKRFAPALALALAAKNNPQVGASILGGINSAQQRQAGEKAQEDAIKRQQAQQAFENDLKTQTEKDTQQWRADEIAAKTSAGKEASAIAKAIENAPDGASARDVVHKLDPGDSHGYAAALSNPDGSPKDKNPYYKDAAKAEHDAAMAQVAAKRADAYAEQVSANIDNINSQVGLRKSQGKYIDTKTGRVVLDSEARDRQLNAAAHYLGVEANDKPGLDAVKMALDKAQTLAIPINAAANESRAHAANVSANASETRAGNAGTKAGDLSAKSLYGSPWGKVYDEATDKRDKASTKLNAWRNQADGDGNLVNKGKPDPPDLVEPITRLDAQIERMNKTSPPDQSTSTSGILKPGQTNRSLTGKALSLVGTKVNTDGQLGCADGVCKIAKTLGLPVPNTRSAGDLEKGLPSKGWIKVKLAQIQPNDIVIGHGDGPSGRHAQWYVGGGQTLAADSRGKGPNTLNKVQFYADPSTTVWRYAGGPPSSGASPKVKSAPPPSASSPVVLAGNINGAQTVFHAPRSKAEFDALTPAKKAAYIEYYKSQKKG